MVPTWKKDLDALVSETMAFAVSVNEKKLAQVKQADPLVADTDAGSGAKDEFVRADLPVLATIEAVLAEEPMLPIPSPVATKTEWPAKLPPMTLPPSERDEIKQRLANFKAHQLKMQAEREDYYLQTMARTRAVVAGSLSVKDQ
jgi:hypothetical protein